MPRSLKKGPFIHPSILKKLGRVKVGDATVIKTWSRNSTIIPEMVGFTFGVHNGRAFTPVNIKEEMVGHKLGEFSPTRKFVRHGGRMQKELEMKAAEAAKPAAAPEKK
ncbi:MAG: 30S ribosomal protein S19 [Candidatus Sungbacteria bacterium RIFCSPLOWO2_02_FULL_47_9]|uniref:Small ribosomal subunit protein uS19 n=1 Tax=Candidatus Sungbacteria bacterium RIFCSPHIGHO2_01_FULL_47_32 TaxID=1802264 RepID=A0A1G2K723_9BACT|nr:MAG: Ribosomal protein S19 [Parcubacteria group bacterium GW2011_GWA2_47_10]OGZ94371.1 MAG: 30S ribosomal protein S19 [Candidatus Sungbacteria bacterium RIFCSPHIGHO2_01_FULL_47_32]OGZ98348.1 MAG: 30S ribosomal protein S19 [Candidatus Sungbacteria bacterium RIFCSPHIGHO2_02_FULL_46_12]OHA04944.1 MAG: 30S ribosomal protein S19 [Candidatus Sungbacteria bacterium RIFCSPLOWO2_01_FULL_47_32]OHA12050.1 MAG: 30S ribosomal protein S19 [Candidatus Sungbacteria bacterium RIFCSPLOWO2_02_FULL_47_9]